LDHINPFDIIINCVGILRERWGETFESVYQQAPTAMAQACATLKKRFIHITALGLTEQASSGFITAKLAGERQIEQIGSQACIVRPVRLEGLHPSVCGIWAKLLPHFVSAPKSNCPQALS